MDSIKRNHHVCSHQTSGCAKESFESLNVCLNLKKTNKKVSGRKEEKFQNRKLFKDCSNVAFNPQNLKTFISACPKISNHSKLQMSETITGSENFPFENKKHTGQVKKKPKEKSVLSSGKYLNKHSKTSDFRVLKYNHKSSNKSIVTRLINNSKNAYFDTENKSPVSKKVKFGFRSKMSFKKEGLDDDDFDAEIKKCCEVLKCNTGDLDLGNDSSDCEIISIEKNKHIVWKKEIKLEKQSTQSNINDGKARSLTINSKEIAGSNITLNETKTHTLFIDSNALNQPNVPPIKEYCKLVPEVQESKNCTSKAILENIIESSSTINENVDNCLTVLDANEDVLSILCTESDLDYEVSSCDEGLESRGAENNNRLLSTALCSKNNVAISIIEESTIGEVGLSFLSNSKCSYVEESQRSVDLKDDTDNDCITKELTTKENETLLVVSEVSDSENETGLKSCNSKLCNKILISEESKSLVNDDRLANESENNLTSADEELSVYEEAETASNSSKVPKSEVVVPTSNIILGKSNDPGISSDFYEKEKDDINDPGWEEIKKLSTDEERYQQVKNCWQSKTIPDPNKNLTYHSFRKRQFKDDPIQPPKQHKRQATTDLNEHRAKRSRSCVSIFDEQIQSLNKEKNKQTVALMKKKNDEVERINRLFSLQEARYPNQFSLGHVFYSGNSYYDSEILNNLWADCSRQISSITHDYQVKAERCNATFHSELNTLNNAKDEVLQFYSFYRGLNTEEEDPTVLSASQLQELSEIENVYSQFNKYYT